MKFSPFYRGRFVKKFTEWRIDGAFQFGLSNQTRLLIDEILKGTER